MPRPLRHQQADTYYLITNRCMDGMFFLRPDRECRRIIKGCLARAADTHDVRLVCFVFPSNHFHLIGGFPKLNRDAFMADLTGQISTRINSLRGRSGPMFPQRYDDQALLDDASLRQAVTYVLNNPVKDRLVPRADAWPGVTSIDQHRTGEPLVGRWLNHARWTKLRRRKADHERREAMETHRVELHVPDAFTGDTLDERRESLLAAVEDDRERIHAEAEQTIGSPPRFVGRPAIVQQHWRDRPTDSDIDGRSRSRRKLCKANKPERVDDYRRAHRLRSDAYRQAVDALHDGEPDEFPTGMHPPGRARCVGHRQACRDEAEPRAG